jgi:non-specific serine/threonine protein kinase/serine/threonine-protein kinase
VTAERWARIEELFHRAIECTPGERAELLGEAGSTDPELRREVEALLSAYGRAGDLQAAVPEEREEAFTASTLDSNEATPASIIGPYHLIERIGEGGMGEVWLADQRQPVRRRVALKLIKAGMDTREVVKRFESERQALALMDHTAIAKVFDAGSTSHGHPYFVMEYVAGVPMTEYCDKHKLATRERLELFIHVCEGVQHAHQKAIIHRDLKPSNILVSEVDGKPMPRIIDFGVAKAISQPLTAETMYTRAGAIVGTPGYMSPEQADSAGQDIDTRTDIYSLGVVLYELLVGALPQDFLKLPFDEILRKLREEDAPKPSTRLRSLGPESTATAQNRGTDPPSLARQLRGDLDAITLKALEKDRSRRYGSPSELAADIGRHLRYEPVIARPASAGYRARKYIRRHRIGVAAVGALALVMAGAAVAQTLQLRRVTRERDRADRITNFMTSMFKVSNPSEARGNQVTAREILDKASKEIDTGLSKDPELQARMMDTMALTYYGLGLISREQSLLERAVEIQRRVLGPEHRQTLASTSLLAGAYTDGEPAKAEKLIRETLNTQRRVLGSGDPDTVRSMGELVSILLRRNGYPEAETLLREMLDIQRRALGPQARETVSTMSTLAETLAMEGRYPEGEKLQREVLEIQRRILGTESPRTLDTMYRLALVLLFQRHCAESEKLFGEVLKTQRRVLGPEHLMTLNSLEMEAFAISCQGRYSESEALFREAIQAAGKSNETGVLGRAWYNFACNAASAGRRDDAFKFLAQAVDHGYRHAERMQSDSDLKSLHGDPRFEALVAQARQGATPSAQSASSSSQQH